VRIRDLAERIQAFAADRIVLPLITPRKPLPPEVTSWQVIFVGASLTYAWRIPLVYPNFSILTAYHFDKSPQIDAAIARRPQAVVIKECAAYFPNNEVNRDLIELWVDRLKAVNIAPILATVVPVTRAHASKHPQRIEEIWAFNDWLGELASDRQVTLLDLERALRISEQDRHLREDLHSGDGLHLKMRTYRNHLDHLIPTALLSAHELELS